MTDTVLIKPGGTYGVQEFKQAIYDKKPVQALFKQSKYHHFFPQSGSVRGSMGGTFLLKGSQKIMDFSECYMYVKLRLLRGDVPGGQNFPPNTRVWPINSVTNSLFKNLKTTVGQQVITNHESNFAYTSYVQNLLNRSAANRAEELEGVGFYLDDTMQFNSFAWDYGMGDFKNSGAGQRLRRFAKVTAPKQGTEDPPTIDWENSNG